MSRLTLEVTGPSCRFSSRSSTFRTEALSTASIRVGRAWVGPKLAHPWKCKKIDKCTWSFVWIYTMNLSKNFKDIIEWNSKPLLKKGVLTFKVMKFGWLPEHSDKDDPTWPDVRGFCRVLWLEQDLRGDVGHRSATSLQLTFFALKQRGNPYLTEVL